MIDNTLQFIIDRILDLPVQQKVILKFDGGTWDKFKMILYPVKKEDSDTNRLIHIKFKKKSWKA